jgi:hypothetical protein
MVPPDAPMLRAGSPDLAFSRNVVSHPGNIRSEVLVYRNRLVDEERPAQMTIDAVRFADRIGAGYSASRVLARAEEELRWRAIGSNSARPATSSTDWWSCWPRRRHCAAVTNWQGARPDPTPRAAAQWALAEVALTEFLNDPVVPYGTDEATRLIIDAHDRGAFQTISHLTVGELRDWLLAVAATDEAAETGPHPPSGYGPVGTDSS